MRTFLLALLAVAVVGCSSASQTFTTPGASEGATNKKKGTIGVVVLTLDNPFFKVIGDTITAEAEKHGYETVVVSGDDDAAKQGNQVKDFIVKQVSAIVICPKDPQAIGPPIEEANAAGIPVFTTDTACLAPGAEVVCHVATDNLEGGREAGRAMIEALGEAGGKVLVIDHTTESCQARVKGFREVIAEHNAETKDGQIEIVSQLPGGGAKDQGYQAAEDTLQSHGDLAGIFAINDPSALGARAALEKAGKADTVKIIGFDGQPEGKQAIKEGKIYADPIQFPDQMAVKTVDAIVRHFQGETVEKEILIPTKLYRQEDALKDPEL